MMSGTSMATPAVAGVASLLMAQGAKPEEIKKILLETAEYMPAFEGKTTTEGMVNPVAALKTYLGTAPTTDPTDAPVTTTTTTETPRCTWWMRRRGLC